MASKQARGALIGLLLIAATALVLAGCGGGDGSSGSSAEGTSSEGTSSESSGSGGADTAAAEEILAPYIGHYSPEFPVDEPLKEKPSPDTKIGALQEPSAIGGLLVELYEGAAKTAGVQLSVVKAGASASTAQGAAETLISQSPDAVILPPYDPTTISNQLKQMEEKEIPVVSTGMAGAENYPAIVSVQVPPDEFEEYGRVFAAWAVAKHGADTNAVLALHPELSFAGSLEKGYLTAMEELCPECGAEVLPITIEENSKAPNKIVSQLQSHPDVNQILAISDIATGLPAAMKAAQLDVGTVVFPGDPTSLEYIKNGELEAALGEGLGTLSFTAMDVALRSAEGQELTAGEQKGWAPMEILQQKDITFDPKRGWEPEANFAEIFAEYWHAEE